MLTQGLFAVTFGWTTWLALGVGLGVTGLVFVTLTWVKPRLRRLAAASAEEDLPWENLLELMRARQRDRLASGAAPDDDLPAKPDPELTAAISTRYFDSASGRTWNLMIFAVVPLPPSMWNGARVANVL